MDLTTQVSQFGIGVAQTMYKELKEYISKNKTMWKLENCDSKADSLRISYPNTPYVVGLFYQDVDDTPCLCLFRDKCVAIDCPELNISKDGSYGDEIHHLHTLVPILNKIGYFVLKEQ